MDIKTVSVTEAVRNFSDYINRIAYRGEHFVLTKGNKMVAEIRPVPSGKFLGELPNLLESLPSLEVQDIKQFEEGIKEYRIRGNKSEVRDPWDS